VSTASFKGATAAVGGYNFAIRISDSAPVPVVLSQTYSGTVLPVVAAVVLECSASSGNYVGGTQIAPTSVRGPTER
jgi:hypothetical protein